MGFLKDLSYIATKKIKEFDKKFDVEPKLREYPKKEAVIDYSLVRKDLLNIIADPKRSNEDKQKARENLERIKGK